MIAKTLLGGLVGALVGLALHVCLEVFAGIEAEWFAVLIGVLVGVGVRRMDPSVTDRASYLRGALAGLLTLVAVMGSTWVIPKLLVWRGAQAQTTTPVAAPPRERDAQAPAGAGGEAPALERESFEGMASRAGGGPLIRRHEFSVLQFTSIAIGMFLAYELARGTTRVEERDEEGAAPPEQPPEGAAARPAE